MHIRIIIITVFYLLSSQLLTAQEVTGIQSEIRSMAKETDPYKCVNIKNRIINDYKLDSLKDSETIDILNGNVAVAFAKVKKFVEFDKYISMIKNKFNQTSMLNLAAEELLAKNIDADHAMIIAKETLDKYFSFKDDPNARPDGYTKEDWARFMNLAKYPYYDTYAKSLFVLKKYPEALQYQLKAFDGKPEEGLPGSIERYAKLLELTGKKDEAGQFILKMAGLGKMTKGMTEQLHSIRISEKGNDDKFDAYLEGLQKNVQVTLVQELKAKMINETAPAFTLKDINGKKVSLSDYKSKIVVLDLWATWCAPCLASFPAMQKQVAKYPDVEFLFIAVDEKGDDALERVKNFINKNHYPFHVLMDEPINKTSNKYKITSTYKPNGIPAKYFIDREGRIRFKSKGFDSDSELINEIDAMITILKGL